MIYPFISDNLRKHKVICLLFKTYGVKTLRELLRDKYYLKKDLMRNFYLLVGEEYIKIEKLELIDSPIELTAKGQLAFYSRQFLTAHNKNLTSHIVNFLIGLSHLVVASAAVIAILQANTLQRTLNNKIETIESEISTIKKKELIIPQPKIDDTKTNQGTDSLTIEKKINNVIKK